MKSDEKIEFSRRFLYMRIFWMLHRLFAENVFQLLSSQLYFLIIKLISESYQKAPFDKPFPTSRV